MTAIITQVIEERDLWDNAEIGFDVPPAVVQFNGPIVNQGSSLNQKTGMTYLKSFKLSGTDYTSTAIWPQGVATSDDLVFVSFYHKYAPLQSAVKFTVFNQTNGQSTTVAPVEFVNGKFRRINSHGAIEIIDRYLYMEDSYTMTIRVFDLLSIYSRLASSIWLDGADPFMTANPPIFEYIMPEIGKIVVNSPSGGNLAYLSHTNTQFVSGNFWIPNSQYSSGGKSMVWAWPMDYGTHEFPVPYGTAEQIEPKYPFGAEVGQSISKIQGAYLTDEGYLILNRSYGSGTYQLIVLDTNREGIYFAGDTTNGLGHNWKNWLYGCEDISCADGQTLVTVTEFQGDRDVTFWRLSDMLGLLNTYLPPTIVEHQATLAALIATRDALNNEISYLAEQIESAVQLGLPRFDRLTFVP